jgi:hypothetical protein
MARPGRQCRRRALETPVLAPERGFRAGPKRYPCRSDGSVALRSARITGPAPWRSISQRRDPGCQASPARRKLPSSSRGARIATTFRIGQSRPTQLWQEGCVFVRSERHPGVASAGPGLAHGTVGQHPGMDGDCPRTRSLSSGASRSARDEVGRRVTAFPTRCRAVELDGDSGRGLY